MYSPHITIRSPWIKHLPSDPELHFIVISGNSVLFVKASIFSIVRSESLEFGRDSSCIPIHMITSAMEIIMINFFIIILLVLVVAGPINYNLLR